MQQPDYTWAVGNYERGATLAYLARELGVSKCSVMRAMRKRGATQTQEARDHWRFWSNVDKTPTCWLWTGALTEGYGAIVLAGEKRKAHRVAYEWFVGPIPDGLQLDHLCRVRNCVNPKHLEAVTFLENVRRGLKGALATHCKNGHPYDEANTVIRPNGGRACRICIDRRNAAVRARRRAQQEPRACALQGCDEPVIGRSDKRFCCLAHLHRALRNPSLYERAA